MIKGELVPRRSSDDPPAYRIEFDGVEVGSISERMNHVHHRTYWAWGIDTMPLFGGGEPMGEAEDLSAAKAAFREGFFRWANGLQPGDWQRIRAYKKATAERRPAE